jgi:hypothetical protein
MRVSNPDCSPVGIHCRNPSPSSVWSLMRQASIGGEYNLENTKSLCLA